MLHSRGPGERLRTHILLMEDHEDLLRVATDLLQRREWVVVGTDHKAEEAIAQIQDLNPEVVLLDLDGPGADCLATIRYLRGVLPQAGIIGLTLSKGSAYRHAALAAGADDVVCKSDLVTDLPAAIGRVARRRRCRPRRAVVARSR